MVTTRAVHLLACLGLLAGCATSSPKEDDARVWLVGDSGEEDDWFCEPAENGGWDCVQDPERVANPTPVRLPKPLFTSSNALPPPGLPTSLLSAQPLVPEDTSAIPLYQRLAYEPEVPTALAKLPGSFHAIQLIALGSREDLEQFIIENDLPLMSGAVVEKDGKRFFALLAGIYEDRETAERAAESLPEQLSVHGPWVRSLESLHAAMARAEGLPEDGF